MDSCLLSRTLDTQTNRRISTRTNTSACKIENKKKKNVIDMEVNPEQG